MAVQPIAADSIETCENVNLIHKCGLPCLARSQDSVSSVFSLAPVQTHLPRPCYPPTGEVISFLFSLFFKTSSSLRGAWFLEWAVDAVIMLTLPRRSASLLHGPARCRGVL